MASYLLNEDGSKILLADLSGALLLDDTTEQVFWRGFVGNEHGVVHVDSWQMGPRDNPSKLRW